MEYLANIVDRLTHGVTGAKKGETARVFLCFVSLFFLLISYYLIKPLRSSKFLSEFDPHYLPLMSIGVVVLSFAITKVFNQLGDRVEKYRLVASTFAVIVALELLFGWLLTGASKPSVIAFYFFSSVYFLLALSATWACINDIFTPEQGRRCYGFVALGSTLGGIAGSAILNALTNVDFSNYATAASGLCMFISLGFLFLAARERRQERASGLIDRQSAADKAELKPDELSPKRDFFGDIKGIFSHPYVLRIGIMVASLAVANSVIVEYSSGVAVDLSVAQTQFKQHFSYLSEQDFSVIFKLKSASTVEREQQLSKLAIASSQPLEKLNSDYQLYRTSYEKETTRFFASVYFWQGILGIFLLLVVARLIFTFAGVRFATTIMPILAGVSAVIFTTTTDLFLIEAIVVLLGSTNYSLNNAAKELLYTATDEDTKFKYKPLIEGPGMRLGDLSANLVILATLALSAQLGWGELVARWLVLGFMLITVAFWLRASYLAGKEFDAARSQKMSFGS